MDRASGLLNEAAERMLGLTSAAGRRVVMFENPLKVIGVERLGQIIRMGPAIAVIIVMRGIFMLVSQSISRRTKEIGIRKVLGGSTSKMPALPYYSSLKWIAIASVIALAVSYFMLDQWLQNYVVKAPVSWWLFVQEIIIVLVLETVITIGQTWRVARRNPVESLRYE